jgi:excisionase family DNA binding protein
MSTKKKIVFDPSDWISPAEAARIRGVTRQAITKLIQTGRLTVFSVGGRKLVRKDEIEAFAPLPAGRPRK